MSDPFEHFADAGDDATLSEEERARVERGDVDLGDVDPGESGVDSGLLPLTDEDGAAPDDEPRG